MLASPILRTVALGSGILGAVSGALGCFALLRRQSLVGDAVSHAALPGIALAFLLTGTKSSVGLLLGAALAGWVGMVWVLAIMRTTRLDENTALGIVLATFFGFGLVLLTFIQRLPNANQAGLDTYLFGQAATMLHEDVLVLACGGVLLMGIVALFWKEFKLVSFDREFAATVGYPVHRLELLLTLLLVGGIVLGLRTVGVVLMSAMIVAPAAAARQWTNHTGMMVVLAALFGAGAGVGGAVASSLVAHLPTGPAIVVGATMWAVGSLFFGAKRGLLWQWLRLRILQRQLAEEAILIGLYELAQTHGGERHGHAEGAIRALSPNIVGVRRRLRKLEQRRLVEQTSPRAWALTEMGQAEAQYMVEKAQEKR
ncbi:MAG: iron chelate uptake ABC transporter family permease subunit [Candidatus Sumerlaeaceae bacterium]